MLNDGGEETRACTFMNAMAVSGSAPVKLMKSIMSASAGCIMITAVKARLSDARTV